MGISILLGKMRRGEPVESLAGWLDQLRPAVRLDEVRGLGPRDQARLYELAAGRGCTLDSDCVPGAGPLREVIHAGRNSLPAFRDFQKRFCPPSAPRRPPVCWGYNHQAMAPFTGPGYFVAREDEAEGGVRTVVVDYTALPDERPPVWPAILPNTARLSRFIYNGTRDWMWKVSEGVTVGRARRESGWMDNWFVLVRL